MFGEVRDGDEVWRGVADLDTGRPSSPIDDALTAFHRQAMSGDD